MRRVRRSRCGLDGMAWAPVWAPVWALVWALAGVACAQTPAPMLPVAVAYDAAGDLYIADAGRHQVFEATLAGQWVVIAGSGVQGFGGDGGAATAAQLNEPQGLAVGEDGTVYIADTMNHRIRAVVGGVISTVVGNGVAGTAGDGLAATAANLREPRGVAITAAGDLIVCDTGNHRIRRVHGGVIAAFAGTGIQGFAGDGGAALSAAFDTPEAVAVAADGRVLIADAHNNRVRVVSVAGLVTTFAGAGQAGYSGDGGAATVARFSQPRGVAVDAAGNVMVADANNQRIRLVSGGGTVATVAGTGTQGVSAEGTIATAAALNVPRGVAVSSFGEATFADTANGMVRVAGGDGRLYQPAALVPGRTSAVAGTTGTLVYGATTLPVVVSGMTAPPLGQVQVMEKGSTVGQGSLSAGAAVVLLPGLGAGTHTLTVQYLGDGLNPAAAAAPATVSVAQAASRVAETIAASVAAGVSLPLTATVSAATSGTPTGTVTFLDGTAQVATVPIVNGVAKASITTLAAGTHTIVSSYSGDANFFASLSPATITVVGSTTAADFTVMSSGAASQSVGAGSAATYVLVVGAQGGAFNGAVSLSVAGLPAGATASFAPPQLIPGTGAASSTLTVQTAANVVQGRSVVGWYAVVAPLLMLSLLRRRGRTPLLCLAGLICLTGLSGCGARTTAESSQGVAAQSYTLTVTGTGTSAIGALLVHSTTLTLTVH